MARPSKGRRRVGGVTKGKKVAFRSTFFPNASAKGAKRGATKAGGPGYTPSNQWYDVWVRVRSGMFTRRPGSGTSKRNHRR